MYMDSEYADNLSANNTTHDAFMSFNANDQTFEELQSKVEELQETIDSLECHLENVHQQKSFIETEKDGLTQRLAITKCLNQELDKKVTTLKNDNEEAKKRILDSHKINGAKSQMIDKLTKDLTKARAQIRALGGTVKNNKELNKKVRELELANGEMEQKLSILGKKEEELNKWISELQSTNDELVQRNATLESQFRDMNIEIDELSQKVQLLESNRQQLIQRISAALQTF